MSEGERASEGAAAEEEQNRVSKKEESRAIIQWGSAAGEARRQMNIFELAWRGVVPFRRGSLPLFLGASLHSAIFSRFPVYS